MRRYDCYRVWNIRQANLLLGMFKAYPKRAEEAREMSICHDAPKVDTVQEILFQTPNLKSFGIQLRDYNKRYKFDMCIGLRSLSKLEEFKIIDETQTYILDYDR
jgi:hypothetical protein